MDTLSVLERLRHEARDGTVVVVRIVEPVRVELGLAVVEVEDRRVREAVIVVGIIASTHPWHRTLRFTACWKQTYILSVLNLIRQHPVRNLH
ncbi:MAG: hypothetical protein QY311_02655 [Candidatus Paceibacterota bacterium]|nr:MAG: hypothetical protein QY311_02655 [Candidatus Paceibacterota bacterium]